MATSGILLSFGSEFFFFFSAAFLCAVAHVCWQLAHHGEALATTRRSTPREVKTLGATGQGRSPARGRQGLVRPGEPRRWKRGSCCQALLQLPCPRMQYSLARQRGPRALRVPASPLSAVGALCSRQGRAGLGTKGHKHDSQWFASSGKSRTSPVAFKPHRG